VYSGSADWEGGRQPDEPAAGRDGGRGGGRRRGADAGGGDAAAAAEGAAAAAAAAFQPGQAVAVTGGNFRDFEGRVVAAEGGRVTAELDIFVSRRRRRAPESAGLLLPPACCLVAHSGVGRRRQAQQRGCPAPTAALRFAVVYASA
jgi:hypothetical protein